MSLPPGSMVWSLQPLFSQQREMCRHANGFSRDHIMG
jgi:hypothetical protein